MAEEVAELEIPNIIVNKEFHELAMGFSNIFVKLYEPLSDGAQWEDLPEVASCIPDLMEIIQSSPEAWAGVKEDRIRALYSIIMALDYAMAEVDRIKGGE